MVIKTQLPCGAFGEAGGWQIPEDAWGILFSCGGMTSFANSTHEKTMKLGNVGTLVSYIFSSYGHNFWDSKKINL